MARILLNYHPQLAPRGAEENRIAQKSGSMTFHLDSALRAGFRFEHDEEIGYMRLFEAGLAKKGE
jgi:hypothetical protein